MSDENRVFMVLSPKTKTETKTCKNGSRDQDSSLENFKSANNDTHSLELVVHVGCWGQWFFCISSSMDWTASASVQRPQSIMSSDQLFAGLLFHESFTFNCW